MVSGRSSTMNWEQFKESIERLTSAEHARVSLFIQCHEGVIERNSKTVYSAASTIKIPILIEAFRQAEEGLLDLEQSVAILPSHIIGGAGILQALSLPVQMKLIDVMSLMIVVSDNTATNILIDMLGRENIEKCLRLLHLHETALKRKLMDFEASRKGYENVTSSHNLALCLKVLTEDYLLNEKSRTKALEILSKQQFQKLAKSINNKDLKVYGKTGELPGVSHDAVIVKRGANLLYAAVLMDQITKEEEACVLFGKIGRLIEEYMSDA